MATPADQKRAKTQQARGRLDAAGGARERFDEPIMTMQGPSVVSASGASSASASACAGGDSASAPPSRVIFAVAIDCDMSAVFTASHTPGSFYNAREMLLEGYDVLLKARGRTNPNSRTPRSSILTLIGGREQIRAAYAALYDFVQPRLRQQRLLLPPADTFRQFPLPPEDEALTRPDGSEEADVEASVDPDASVEETITESIGEVTVTRAGIDRLPRETTLTLSLQDHLLSDLDFPMTRVVPPPPAPFSAPHHMFTDQQHLQFRRACLLALERVQAHAQKSY